MLCLRSRVPTLVFLMLFVFLGFCLPPGGALCQETDTPEQPTVYDELRRSQYQLRLGTEDELQFYVHIWGQVQKPGLYLVADGTDVVGLISIAGGPTDGAKLGKITLVRSTPASQATLPVDMKLYMGTGDCSGIPILEPGDTVIVPATFWQRFIRFGTILSVAALFANVIVYATR